MSQAFLTELFAPYDEPSLYENGLCEIRTLAPLRYSAPDAPQPPAPRFFGLTHLAKAAQYARAARDTFDVYMGVLPRAHKAPVGKGGLDKDVEQAAWLWCDIDNAEATEAEVVDFMHHIKSRLPHPRLVVRSGSGGVHLYWRLPAAEDVDAKRLGSVLRRVVAAVGSGPSGLHADKACANASRILRLPQTFNHKHDPPRPVVGAVCDAADRLTLAEWESTLPMEALAPSMLRPKFKTAKAFDASGPPPGLVRWAEQGYGEGTRHHDLVGAAAFLRRTCDLPEDTARRLFDLKAANAVGRRLITDDELDRIWTWAG